MNALKVVGVILMILVIAVWGFVGITWCLAGGIQEIVNGVVASPANGHDISWGVVRLVCFFLEIATGVVATTWTYFVFIERTGPLQTRSRRKRVAKRRATALRRGGGVPR